MPVQVSYPGVYIQEVASGVRTITGVSTSVALFVGMASRGQMRNPTRVLSFTEFERKFGASSVSGELTDQLRQFFENKGGEAYVMRIANGDVAATVTLHSEFDARAVLTVTAKDSGSDGDAIRLAVDYDTITPESTFNLVVYRQTSAGGGLARDELETHSNLSMDPASPRYVVEVVNQQSALIDVAPGPNVSDAPVAPFQGYSIFGRLFASSAAFKAAIDSSIAATGATIGQFQVSVDSGPFVPVSIAPSDITGATAAADLSARINEQLVGFGLTSTVSAALINGPDPLQYVQVSSDIVGGSVAFRPSVTADIAVALEMSNDTGGLEVSGHARSRPAPSGVAMHVGALAGAAVLDRLSNFAEQVGEAITDYTVVDSSGSHSFPVSLAPATERFYASGAATSLRFVQQRLQAFATRINTDAGSDPTLNWRAVVHGYRLVLMPEFGGANAIASAFSTAGTGTFDLGAVGEGMEKPNSAAYSLGTTGIAEYQSLGGAGLNGGIPQPNDYDAAYKLVESNVDLFNLLILPRVSGQTDTQRDALWGPASNFCERRRAFLLIDPRQDWRSVSDVSAAINTTRIGLVKDHAAIYWPRLQLRDPITGMTKPVDPAGSIAGIMARVDANRGVWKAPAGLGADIRRVRGVEHPISDPENGVINQQAVNAIRLFPNGIVSWGARTLDGFDNSPNNDYRYVPVRRFALYIEESLYRGLKFAVFEPNDEPLWAQIRLAAGAFMNNLFRQGAFQGRKANDAYFVKVDSETTTQNDINLGVVNVVIGFAPLKPAEFVVVTIQQIAGQVQT